MTGSAERLLVRGALGWLGPGRIVDRPAVVVEGSRIRYAGRFSGAPEAQEEIVGDWFLMPAVIDRHVHIGLSDPGAVLLGGVTAVRDLAWPPEEIFPLADASEGPSFNGPLIRAAGPMLTAPGGYPTRSRWAPPGTGLEIRGPEEAARAVRGLADRGAALIKVSLNAEAGPTPSDEEVVAIREAARDRGLPVVAHVQGKGQAERAVGAGLDEIAHCPWTERPSDRTVEAMARALAVVSTLDIHCYGHRTPELEVALGNLARFLRAGGRVLYGTDLGNGPIPPGIDVREVLLLAEAGLDPEGLLRAMTRAPLEPGAPADLIGLDRNPFEDPAALGDVRFVMRAGRVVRKA